MRRIGCYPLLAVRFCHGLRPAPDKRVLNLGLSQYNAVQFFVGSAVKQEKKPPSRSLRNTLWHFALRYPRLARVYYNHQKLLIVCWCCGLAENFGLRAPVWTCPLDPLVVGQNRLHCRAVSSKRRGVVKPMTENPHDNCTQSFAWRSRALHLAA